MPLAGAVVFLAALTLAVAGLPERPREWPKISLVAGASGVLVARGPTGDPVWSYRHPEGRVFRSPQVSRVLDIDGDGEDELLIATNTQAVLDQDARRGELFSLSRDGTLRWRRTSEDSFHFGATLFEGPWVSELLDVLSVNDRLRIMWPVHHYRWWPSVLHVLDGGGDLSGKFVNSGWILSSTVVARPEGDLVLLGGISNSRGGAMLAVLDGDSMWGTSPEDLDGEFACRDCPEGDALIYFVFPPSHVNRASGLPYNRTASVEAEAKGVQTIVVEGEVGSGVHWIYEFSRDLELRRVTPGDSYWPAHRLLRLEGKIDHAEEDCPERFGAPVRRWTRATGWVEVNATAGLAPTA